MAVEETEYLFLLDERPEEKPQLSTEINSVVLVVIYDELVVSERGWMYMFSKVYW